MNLWATATNGPVKYPVIRAKTDRVDVEVIGPSEALDLETGVRIRSLPAAGRRLPLPLPRGAPLCGGYVGLLARVQHDPAG